MEQNNIQGQAVKEISEKSWVACLLLLLFLGGIFAHKFYVGRIKEALISIGIFILSFILVFAGPTIGLLFFSATSAVVGTLIFILAVIGFAYVVISLIVDFVMILIGKFKDSEGKLVTK